MIMKAPILGLAVASAAFAGSSLYFWNQVQDERAQAALLAESTRKLNARVIELEKARADFAQRRTEGEAITGSFGSATPARANAPGVVPAQLKAASGPMTPMFTTHRIEPSAAMQKMMRSQARVIARRQYADVGEALGLSKETTAKLIDLIAEQQSELVPGPRDGASYVDAGNGFEQRRREQEQAIFDLIGADKAQAFQEYQKTIPARQDADMIARQLEDNGAPLSEAQRKQLAVVVYEEQNRAVMPQFTEGMDQQQYGKAVNDWRDDYDRRIAEQAARFLTPEQISAYNDILQWQKDIRDQSSSGVYLNVGYAAASGSTSLQTAGKK